jgi:hypothetical protein
MTWITRTIYQSRASQDRVLFMSHQAIPLSASQREVPCSCKVNVRSLLSSCSLEYVSFVRLADHIENYCVIPCYAQVLAGSLDS